MRISLCLAILTLPAFRLEAKPKSKPVAARLYNLSTAEISTLSFINNNGHGPISGTINFIDAHGEFNTVSDDVVETMKVPGVIGKAKRTVGSDQQKGSAIVTAGELIIQCDYTVNARTRAGEGQCTDNKGIKYKLMF